MPHAVAATASQGSFMAQSNASGSTQDDNVDNKGPRLICVHCLEDGFQNTYADANSLRKHQGRTHNCWHTPKPYTCGKCSKIFDQRPVFLTHQALTKICFTHLSETKKCSTACKHTDDCSIPEMTKHWRPQPGELDHQRRADIWAAVEDGPMQDALRVENGTILFRTKEAIAERQRQVAATYERRQQPPQPPPALTLQQQPAVPPSAFPPFAGMQQNVPQLAGPIPAPQPARPTLVYGAGALSGMQQPVPAYAQQHPQVPAMASNSVPGYGGLDFAPVGPDIGAGIAWPQQQHSQTPYAGQGMCCGGCSGAAPMVPGNGFGVAQPAPQYPQGPYMGPGNDGEAFAGGFQPETPVGVAETPLQRPQAPEAGLVVGEGMALGHAQPEFEGMAQPAQQGEDWLAPDPPRAEEAPRHDSATPIPAGAAPNSQGRGEQFAELSEFDLDDLLDFSRYAQD